MKIRLLQNDICVFVEDAKIYKEKEETKMSKRKQNESYTLGSWKGHTCKRCRVNERKNNARFDILSPLPQELFINILCYLKWWEIIQISRITPLLWEKVRGAAKHVANFKGYGLRIADPLPSAEDMERHVLKVRDSVLPSDLWELKIQKTKIRSLVIPKNIRMFTFLGAYGNNRVIDLAGVKNLRIRNRMGFPQKCNKIRFVGQQNVVSVNFTYLFPVKNNLDSFTSLKTIIVRAATLGGVNFHRGCEKAVISLCTFEDDTVFRNIERVYILGCRFGIRPMDDDVKEAFRKFSNVFQNCGSIRYFRSRTVAHGMMPECDVYDYPCHDKPIKVLKYGDHLLEYMEEFCIGTRIYEFKFEGANFPYVL